METTIKSIELTDRNSKVETMVSLTLDKTGFYYVTEYVKNGKGDYIKSGNRTETVNRKYALQAYRKRVRACGGMTLRDMIIDHNKRQNHAVLYGLK